jgi:hypothetical protein
MYLIISRTRYFGPHSEKKRQKGNRKRERGKEKDGEEKATNK